MDVTCLDRPKGKILTKDEALRLYESKKIKLVVFDDQIVCGPGAANLVECFHRDYVPLGKIATGGTHLRISDGMLEISGYSSAYGSLPEECLQNVQEALSTFFGLPIKPPQKLPKPRRR